MIMHIVDLVGHAIDGVDSSGRCAYVRGEMLRESAQTITPPSYLTAMMVVPMVSFW